MAFSVGTGSVQVGTYNFDTILTLAYANAGDDIADAISKENAVLNAIKANGMYKGESTPEPNIMAPLMHQLGNAEWYDAWDVLNTQPTEGLTVAQYPWRDLACPVGYNFKEARLTNPNRVKDLIQTKIEQTKLTMAQTWNTAVLQGNIGSPGGLLTDEAVSSSTGRSGITPLPALVYFDSNIAGCNKVTAAFTVGGISQATYDWWRNWTYDVHAITTYVQLLAAWDAMYEACLLGPGGAPDLIVTDKTTRSLLRSAYIAEYRRTMDSQNDYPFDNLLFHKAKVVVDEMVPDVYNATTGTGTNGTAYFLNTKFMAAYYDTEANFTLTDFQKPVNQMGKVAHSIWRGNLCMLNRRKQGVIAGIPRTLA